MEKLKFIFPMALQSFKANPFHTFLSILGIIIGVGALFSILSLADGMEKMGRDQITSTSNLQSLAIQTNEYKTVDNIQIRKDSFGVFNIPKAKALESLLTNSNLQMTNVKNVLVHGQADSIQAGGQKIGLYHILEKTFKNDSLLAGRVLTNNDINAANPFAVINKELFSKIYPNKSFSESIGSKIIIGKQELEIVGILEVENNKRAVAQVYIPLTLFSEAELAKVPSTIVVDIKSIEAYESENEIIKEFLDQSFSEGSAGFSIISYANRMKQLMQGMAVFRIVMGMIVGISVLVGGIGIMNVLLMSIKERTKEIGVRKACGASRKMIKWQFLLEAMLISLIGCLLGVILGVIVMSVAVPLLQHFTDMPFGWVFSLQTTLIIVTVALIIGIVFGTYPAIKAARLDPIIAIRHE